jgi:hypothetical protein
MKTKKLYEELIKIVNDTGIVVRKDILKSRGGYCLLDDNKLIILNKMLPEEIHCRILAKCIGELNIHNSNNFIAPIVREYIENEISLITDISDVEIKIENN